MYIQIIIFLQKAKPQHNTNAVVFIKETNRKRKKTEERFSVLTLQSALPGLIFICNR